MSKKGVSLEEKRTRILSIFHEEDDVFNLKQIEKLGSAKGVVLQSVKEILQSLVDDDLVHQDKIGISNFFWAFAAEASTKLHNDLSKLEQQLKSVQSQHAQVDAELEEQRAALPDAALTQALAAEVAQAEARLAELQAERAARGQLDPERFGQLKEAAVIARDSANRWLDNCHALQDWSQKKFEGREKEVVAFFEEKGLTDKVVFLD